MRIKRRTGLVLALDVTDWKKAMDITGRAAEYLDAVKVNYPIILGCGPGIITQIVENAGVPVIADFKVADVPHTNRAIAKHAFELGASGIICQPFTGTESVEACALAARDAGADIYVVVAMSHPGAGQFFSPRLDEFVKLALEVEADGVIAPATRLEELRRVSELIPDTMIMSPGVGAQGGDAREAVEAGADFIIVGRAIYDAEDPGSAAAKFVTQPGR